MTEWQPIETAPRDGTRILVYTAERCRRCLPGTVGMAVMFWDGAWAIVDGIHARHLPTHWKPLPEPPQ